MAYWIDFLGGKPAKPADPQIPDPPLASPRMVQVQNQFHLGDRRPLILHWARNAVSSRTTLVLALALLVLTVEDGCSSRKPLEQQSWHECEVAETVAPCDAYLDAFPVGLHAGAASDRKRLIMNTAAAKLFIAEEAEKRLDEKAWQTARTRDTNEAYRTYLSDHPNGAHVTEARQKIGPENCVQRKLRARGYNDGTNCITNYKTAFCKDVSRYNAEVNARNECYGFTP